MKYYIGKLPVTPYLEHFGILGMKWGIRRYQNLDGSLTAEGKVRYGYSNTKVEKPVKWKTKLSAKDKEDIRIDKNTEFQNISMNEARSKNGHVYVSYTDHDNILYSGFYASTLKDWYDAKKVYLNKIKVKDDLIAPSKEKRIQEFIDMYSDQKTETIDYLTYGKLHTLNLATMVNMLPFVDLTKHYTKKYSDLGEDQLAKLYPDFSAYMVGEYGKEDWGRKEYFDRLQKKGYNAITDDHDIKDFGSDAPMIIFNGNKTISDVVSRIMSDEEINKKYEEAVNNALAKK